MPGETTENNAPNTQITNNEEGNKVHYHLSANVKFDKKNAFNGTTNPDGNYDNPNIEKFSVQITFRDNNKKFINNNSSNETIDFQQLKNYKKIMINDKLYELEQVQNGNNLKILNCNDRIDNDFHEYFFYGESKDNKNNIDKTFAGNTYNIFAKNPTVEGEPQIQQFYHGGSKSGYSQDLIQEKKSFTLFYTRENIPDLNNENSLLIGLGEIQNKIGVLDTNDEKRKGKIYCYDHYENSDGTENYHLFRFPYQELIDIANNGNNDSAKQFLEELVEPLSIENSDKPFFSKEQSKLISTYIVLKYANRLYEQIMKLKQNNSLWGAVKTASGTKWHFCDDDSIRFLKLSIEKLKKAQLKQNNPGLWALKDYFQINQGSRYEDFIDICSGEIGEINFTLFNSNKDYYHSFKKFILETLIKYPIYNKRTKQRIFEHLGLRTIYRKKNDLQDISTSLSKLEINGKNIENLLERVNNNKKIESDDKLFDIDSKFIFKTKKEEINKYLYKHGFCEIAKFQKNKINDHICLTYVQPYKINILQQKNQIVTICDITKNPYLLFEKYIQSDDAPLLLDDIDWGQKIIQKDTFKVDNVYRFRAIVVEYIKKQENQTGHVWVSYEDAQEYLNDRLYELDSKNGEFYKIVDLIDKDEFKEVFEKDNQFLTLKEFANKEKYIKSVIENLINKSSELTEEQLEEDINIEDENYIESEKSLIKMKKLDFVFISGVAGSGKSHTLCKYLDYLAEKNFTDFQVLTPSGKAANVIKNKIKNDNENFNFIKEINDLDKKISTADRYIVDSNKFWNHRLFARVDDGSTPDENIDVLIIDEISMITLDTLYYILKIKKPKKLIILGDIKQLPPIGYGSLATSIYNHLFLESSICLAKMETSHRADDNSQFIKHSLTLRDKEKQLKKEDLEKNIENSKEELGGKGNFVLIPYSNQGNQTIGEIIKNIYKIESIEKKDDFKKNIIELNEIIQILTPNRIGESGTYAINEIFKNDLGGREAKEGLKFIYNKNDKATGLSNGTMGYYEQVNEVNKETKKVEQKDKINFDGKKVPYSGSFEDTNYELGFSITVHKSQGSGFPIVILVLPKQNNSLITKELIYTALTRPEQKMYILYHQDNIEALTQLPSIPHRNMNLFDRDKLLWIKDEIEYPIGYNGIDYRKKQDLYFALMLEYSDVEDVEYHKNGSFVWIEKKTQTDEEIIDETINDEKLLMPKFYIEEKQDEKSFKYLKSIDLREVYKNFEFKLGDIEYNPLANRDNENKVDIIEDNNDSIEITTHNGLRTRSWSEAILMLIFDNLKIPYFYEVEIRREKNTNNEEINTYKLTYSNPEDKNYRIPDFTISAQSINFTDEDKKSPIVVNNVECIIEHLGMLTNESYLSKWKEKVKDYYEKYKFDLVAPLSSLNCNNGVCTIEKKWVIGKDEATTTDNVDGKKLNICFTTDEKDLEDIKTLIEQLILLKEFYSLN
ncbi:AAA family ATPase [Aliarcobacter cryaerophilus]|uniref:ATP-dependent DNA helicase n=1 Tax=Aliarcobacter cryaerophilus TaxID=28198 RepID=UPI003DA43F5C